jgi:hypothetical protein
MGYFGRLAQLVRAADLHSAGRGFESLSAHEIEIAPWMLTRDPLRVLCVSPIKPSHD